MLKRQEVEILLKAGIWRDSHRRSSNGAGMWCSGSPSPQGATRPVSCLPLAERRQTGLFLGVQRRVR
jgi:hypothetical protein